MSSIEIEQKVRDVIVNFSKEEFLYDLLQAYGISKTSVTRLKKGDYNLSKESGEVLYKSKVFFKEGKTDSLLATIESISQEDRVLKHKPRFAILTDYATLVAKDLKLKKNLDISIEDLPKHFAFFLPLAGSEVYSSSNDNEADRNAAYKMAELYDVLIHDNPNIYTSKNRVHELNIFLSRLLFCYFAEDTGIFEEESIFTNTLGQHTSIDGSDTHLFLDRLFQKLNVKNSNGYAAHFAGFPYVNGGLFRDNIQSPVFSSKARRLLLELGELDWKDINPDIFGSMIQAVVIPEYRSDLGMHYTSVPNILKLIRPLFLDDLYESFEKYQNNSTQLRKLIIRLASIKFFDPACGSGNFLIITYKEVRLLEIRILQQIISLEKIEHFTAAFTTSISLNQFYGIELDDFAHEMAILSLWLAEHQMNKIFDEVLEGYGASKPILPLKEAGQIKHGNAARVRWEDVCTKVDGDEIYLIGNPPYLGSRNQEEDQKRDLEFVFKSDFKSLDYVSIWFYKGARFIHGYNAQMAFVSTNSICQGLLVPLTWPRVLGDSIEIAFAHQSFKWTNNAKGNAGVTVVIVGLRNKSTAAKFLFSDNIKKQVKNINAYLLNANDVFVRSRNTPLSNFPEMNFGNMPAEGGRLLFGKQEKIAFTKENPETSKYFRRIYGSDEFINGLERWCLWFENIMISDLEKCKPIKRILDQIREIRLDSSRPKLAQTPHLFAQVTQDTSSDFLIVPSVSSEKRPYIPIGYMGKDAISTNLAFIVSNPPTFLFGVLHSRMHMVWVKSIGGKLETRYRYSKDICYNTFPFPKISSKQEEQINLYVFSILDERAKHPEKTMAQLYSPDTMPAGLKRAHEELDDAIEKCYRLQPFTSENERLEFLFKVYEELVQQDTLFAKVKKNRKIKK